jgi:hypothetical protein
MLRRAARRRRDWEPDHEKEQLCAEGVALNQLINVAVAKKLSALRTETYLAEPADNGYVVAYLYRPAAR